MANETTSSTISELYTEIVAEALFVASEQSIMRNLVRNYTIAGGGKSVEVPIYATVSASAVSEASDLSNTAVNPTSVTITASEVGIMTTLTDLARNSASRNVAGDIGRLFGEAIARNIYEMMNINVPIICIVIGEGASGGALGIGVGDKILMLENTWYSVISPESCSSILWRSWEHKELAAEALKLTADDMLKNKLIDKIIEEPLGGAHYDPAQSYQSVKENIVYFTKKIKSLSSKKMIELRRKKFTKIGKFKG